MVQVEVNAPNKFANNSFPTQPNCHPKPSAIPTTEQAESSPRGRIQGSAMDSSPWFCITYFMLRGMDSASNSSRGRHACEPDDCECTHRIIVSVEVNGDKGKHKYSGSSKLVTMLVGATHRTSEERESVMRYFLFGYVSHCEAAMFETLTALLCASSCSCCCCW